MGFIILTLDRRLQSVEHFVHMLILRRMCVPSGFCSPMPTKYSFHNCSAGTRRSSGCVIITDHTRTHIERAFWKVGTLCKGCANHTPIHHGPLLSGNGGGLLGDKCCIEQDVVTSAILGCLVSFPTSQPQRPQLPTFAPSRYGAGPVMMRPSSFPCVGFGVLGLRVAGYLRTAKSDSVTLAE